jgi:hypothetical protein
MNLHTLIASHNENITNEGIRHMNLHKLCARFNNNITYEIENGIIMPKIFKFFMTDYKNMVSIYYGK